MKPLPNESLLSFPMYIMNRENPKETYYNQQRQSRKIRMEPRPSLPPLPDPLAGMEHDSGNRRELKRPEGS
jgi:hypothetical protein